MQRLLTILGIMAALLLITGGGAAHAQGTAQAKLIVSARAGYGDTGAYLMGEWLPVRVTLSNPPGGASRRVTVRVATGSSSQGTLGTYQQDVDLPAQSRKEVTLYTYSSDFAHKFSVELYENGTRIDTADATAEPFEPPSNMIVAVASSDASLLNALKGEPLGHVVLPVAVGGYGYTGQLPNASATVAHINLADLPTLSQALDSLGAIVVDDVDSGALSAEQRESIEGWVARGGMLLVTYRAGGADTLAGFDSLVPVTVSGSRFVASLSSVADLPGVPLSTTGSLAIGNAAVKSDAVFASSTRVLALQDGVPVVAVRDVGQGHVVYMGISPGVAPLKGWDGLPALEKLIFSEHALRISYGARLRFSGSNAAFGGYGGSVFYPTYGGMFDLPGLELPSIWLVGGFLLLYIVIIGPLNFIVLRRLRRTELAWFTIPAGVVVFSVIAYLLALGSKGGNLVSIRVNAINTAEGAPVATLEQHFGLFTPLRSTYRFAIDAESAVTEMDPYGYYQARNSRDTAVGMGDGTTSVYNVNIDTWGLRAFVAENTAVLESPLHADLHLGDNVIVGKVKNSTTGPLQDVALVRGDEVQYIGYMAPGEEANVRLRVETSIFKNTSPERLLPLPAGVVSSLQNGYYSNGAPNSAAQREYNRKISALAVALNPLLSGEAPTDMNVITVAWGPTPSTRFTVDGSNLGQEQEVNVWASTAQVDAAQGDQASLDSALVPYSVYAPGNNPSVMPMGNGSYLMYVPQGGQGVPAVPQPVPTTTGGFPVVGLNVAPFIELRYRLPKGVEPQSLYLRFSTSDSAPPRAGSPLDVEVYNVQTGVWDQVATVSSLSGKLEQAIANPVQYVGAAGNVTVRLRSLDGSVSGVNGSFRLGLNSTK
jgi:hypothetical protein